MYVPTYHLSTSSVYLVSTVPVAGITIYYYLKAVGQGQVYRNLEPPGNIKLTPTYMLLGYNLLPFFFCINNIYQVKNNNSE